MSKVSVISVGQAKQIYEKLPDLRSTVLNNFSDEELGLKNPVREGFWYITPKYELVFITKILSPVGAKGYGFDKEGVWADIIDLNLKDLWLEEADLGVVSDQLIMEAVNRRGFLRGKVFTDINERTMMIDSGDTISLSYSSDKKENTLYINNKYVIFHNGDWVKPNEYCATGVLLRDGDVTRYR